MNGKSNSGRVFKSPNAAGGGSGGRRKEQSYSLRLYVAGQTPKCLSAFVNAKRLCEQYMPGRYKLEVIDLAENPQLAASDQVFAIPTLVRKLPPPLKRIIGSLADKEKFLVGMDLKPVD
jgi:circadian clock protein KaiB